MELWTWTDDGQEQAWSLVGPALDAVSRAQPAIRRLLVVGKDADDEAECLAVIRLVRKLASQPVAIMAGSRNPSAHWRRLVREAGADRTLLVAALATHRDQDRPLDGAIEIDEGLCPELQTLQERHHTVSACGRQKGTRVLARQHLERWCIAGKAMCPHRQGESCG